MEPIYGRWIFYAISGLTLVCRWRIIRTSTKEPTVTMTAEQMKTRQEITDRLTVAAAAYAQSMDESTRNVFFKTMIEADKAGMPGSLLVEIMAAAIAATRPVSIR